MKKSLLIALSFILCMFVSGVSTYAHPGNTDKNGGHTCRTNCPKYGLSYGQYHYHNSGRTTTTVTKPTTVKSTTPKAPKVTKVGVFLNDVKQAYNPSAYLKNGATLVPMRAIFEQLGAWIEFNSQTNTITAHKNQKKIVLKIGSKSATVYTNGVAKTINLNTAAEINTGSTMVPLRFISEALGATTIWDEANLSVYIYAKK